jgi:DNA-binding transcriptional LysR family regulator
MPRIRQLEIVRALAQHRHFGRAAQALGMSQPNLTRGLKQLEALLGVPIFDRQGVTPTSFGEIILRHGDKALASFHELTRELSLAKGLEVGELRIIAGPYPANISGERAVGILLQRHPNIFAEIRSANWERAIGDVLEGAADLGFAEVTGALKNDDLQVQPVRKSQVFFFCAAGHPLAGRERLTLDDLLEYPWAGPSLPERYRAALPTEDRPFAVFGADRNRLHPRALVGSFSAAKQVVLGGHVLSVAIHCQIARELNEGLLVRLPYEAPWLSLNYGFITKRGRTPSPAAQAYMAIVRSIESEIPQ